MRGKNMRHLFLTAVLLALAGPSVAGVNEWTLSLPFPGAVAIDPTNPAIAYVATTAGVFKTTDRGGRWTLVDAFPDAHAVAINPRNPANVVTGNVDSSGPRPTDTRFRWSEDGGLTWQEVPPLNEYEDDLFDRSEAATVYAALQGGGVGKSVDGGKTWTISDWRNGLPCCAWDFFDTMDIAISGGEAPTIYAAALGGGLFFSSTDGAESWQRVMVPVGVTYPDVWTVSVDPTDPGRLYVTGYLVQSSDAQRSMHRADGTSGRTSNSRESSVARLASWRWKPIVGGTTDGRP